MKKIFYILTIMLFLYGCNYQSKPLDIYEIQKKFAREAEISNAKTLKWENRLTNIYITADTNQSLALSTIDQIIISDTSLDKYKIAELHFIKGDIYYTIDSMNQAVEEFTTSEQILNIGSPKDRAARAGAYIKLKQYEKALIDLTKASEINYDYYWNIGNYYEIIGNKDSAISFYNRLYIKDTLTYKKANDRIVQLKNNKTKPLTELILDDRKRSVILWHGVK